MCMRRPVSGRSVFSPSSKVWERMKVMPATRGTLSTAVLDLAHERLPVCPASAQSDLLACLTYLREARAEQGETEKKLLALASVDWHYNKAIAIGSKGISPR